MRYLILHLINKLYYLNWVKLWVKIVLYSPQYAIKLISFLLDVVLTMLTKKVIFECPNILSLFKYLITVTVKHHIYMLQSYSRN